MSDSNSPEYTPQQRMALETRDVSIGLSAGAGCGKTFVLTRRYISMLEPEENTTPLSRIVAITFTDRAAREMRDRVRKECHQKLISASEKDVKHWLSILRGLDSARISTIHSFCSSILRSHAVDAGLDPAFGLMDETVGGAILSDAIKGTIHAIMMNHDSDCMELILKLGFSQAVSLMGDLIQSRFQISWAKFEEMTAEKLSGCWLDNWNNNVVPLLKDRFLNAYQTTQLLELFKNHEPSHEKLKENSHIIQTLLSGLDESEDLLGDLQQLRAASMLPRGKKPCWDDEEVNDLGKKCLADWRKQTIDKLIPKLEAFQNETDHDKASRLTICALHVLKKVLEGYEDEKKDHAVLDYDDLLIKTRDLLKNSESVRKQVASGISYLMVDEFQDTDPIQADLVELLCGEEIYTGKLFFVGDVKQSIYRFRRADPAVFLNLRERIPPEGKLPLNQNFRSQPGILNFVNSIFIEEMGEEYEPLVPFAKPASDDPIVEFLFACDEEIQKKESAFQKRQREADWIARRISQLLTDGVPRVRDSHPETGVPLLRPLESGDICILFRALTNIAIYEEALSRYGLDYYLVGGKAFFAQQEIFDVISLCQYLDDQENQISLCGLLRSPFFSVTDESLFALTTFSGSVTQGLVNPPKEHLQPDQYRQICYASKVLSELHSVKDRIPISQLLNLAVEKTGYDAALLCEFLGERKIANLEKLIGIARQFDDSGITSLKDFVLKLGNAVQEEANEELAATHPESSQVIRMMTIHQSKGLEFPCVVVADMDWSEKSGGGNSTFHPEMGPLFKIPDEHGKKIRNLGLEGHQYQEEPKNEAESIRLLYVALTRPADYLILSAGLGADRKVQSRWLKLISKYYDLNTGLPKVDPYLGKITLSHVSSDLIPAIRVIQKKPGGEKVSQSKRKLPLQKFDDILDSSEPAIKPISLVQFEQADSSRSEFSAESDFLGVNSLSKG